MTEKNKFDWEKTECQQNLSVEILRILNESVALHDTINRILTTIQRETGFDAVGIRLRKGDDFPYFTQNGFSTDFLLTENTLTVRDQDGSACKDENGNIYLECTCGMVLSGRTDPTNSLFTPGGSFWTNDSISLLSLPADQDPRLHPRNRCIHEGFQSIALIPHRANKEIIGLLQLNERKKDCFTLEMIRFFEGISASIGVALIRQQAYEKIKASLEEKEMLMKEIHHRAKNNMQIISSLLTHQMEYIKDKKITDIFSECQNRILSMALVHEKLYRSRDLKNIGFKEYINDLGANLRESYNVNYIKLNMNIEDISLCVDLAIPVGLIINELITNSLKYAFPNGMKGEINISFRSISENMLELVVSDNGIGFPKDLDIRNSKSLGIHLVTLLAENQLHGKIDINRDKGTEFQIKFKGIV